FLIGNRDHTRLSCSAGVKSSHHLHNAPVGWLAERRRDDLLDGQLFDRHHHPDLHGATLVSVAGRRTAVLGSRSRPISERVGPAYRPEWSFYRHHFGRRHSRLGSPSQVMIGRSSSAWARALLRPNRRLTSF